MKFHAVISGDYEVSDAEVAETYEGKTDPAECAALDEASIGAEELVHYLSNVSVTIVPA